MINQNPQQEIEESTQLVRAKLECQKLSLHELLDIMTRTDEGLIDLNGSEQDLVGVLTAEKVDNIKRFRDFVLARAEVLNQQAKELSEAKRQLEGLAERLTKNVAYNMAAQNFKKLPGNNYQVSLQERSKIVIKIEPNSQLFAQYPEIIKREFSWIKKEFDAAVKKEDAPIELKNLCEITKTQFATFTVNKGAI